MGKKHVRFRHINFNTWFLKSMIDGTGFIISEPESVRIDGEKKKTLYGSSSSLYGTTYEDEQSYAERCRCECGRTVGIMFKGETCPFCGKEVKEAGDNLGIVGWIPLFGYYVINPLYYQLLQSAIGNKVFNDIVYARKKVDKDGNISDADFSLYDENGPSSPFVGIGIDEFRLRFDEIMEYFKKKKKSKAPRIEKLQKEVMRIFISHVPCYTTKLRQQSVTADTFYYTGIDKLINSLYSVSTLLENCQEIELPNILWSIQDKVNKMWDFNFSLLNGKEGIIRGVLLGGSLDEYLGEHINSFNCWKLLRA